MWVKIKWNFEGCGNIFCGDIVVGWVNIIRCKYVVVFWLEGIYGFDDFFFFIWDNLDFF